MRIRILATAIAIVMLCGSACSRTSTSPPSPTRALRADREFS